MANQKTSVNEDNSKYDIEPAPLAQSLAEKKETTNVQSDSEINEK